MSIRLNSKPRFKLDPFKKPMDQLKSTTKKKRLTPKERAALGMKPSEDEIQTQIINECQYLKYKGFRVSEIIRHIPNGGLRSKSEAARLKRMGVRAGTPDLLLPVGNHGYISLWIECKTEDGDFLDSQIEQIPLLQKLGNKVVVCRSVADAIDTIKAYLEI
ncbi:VRR-NUC domain-containing protein [Acinetobacter calcoaceticus]